MLESPHTISPLFPLFPQPLSLLHLPPTNISPSYPLSLFLFLTLASPLIFLSSPVFWSRPFFSNSPLPFLLSFSSLSLSQLYSPGGQQKHRKSPRSLPNPFSFVLSPPSPLPLLPLSPSSPTLSLSFSPPSISLSSHHFISPIPLSCSISPCLLCF